MPDRRLVSSLDTRPAVVIAGAGPVGLFLACELGLAGVSVLVIEQAEDPSTALKRLPFGIRGLSIPTLEAFDRRGLLDDLVARASPAPDSVPHWMRQQRRPAGHFAGIQFFHDRIDTARWPYRRPGPVETMPSDLERIETLLAARAEALGVEIRRGTAVQGVAASADGVSILTSGGAVEAGWLVGCDGGRSAVRKAAGFGFAGTEPEFTGYSILVELADPKALAPGRHYTPGGLYTFTPPGTVTMADFDGGAFHRSAVTIEHAEAVLRRISGTDVTLTALHLATTWTDRAFQATAYRRGRVLLAGDAAHVHSPLGGQGLNLGLGDAMNLGWKLAATIRGDAPAELLDSYEAERHPIAARVLDWSRAQVAVMRPSRSSRALEAILRDLVETRDGATYFAERVSGVSLRHDLGGGHDLVGRSAPDFALADGTRLAEHLRAGRGLLLDLDPAAPLREASRGWGDRIAYMTSGAEDRFGLAALLVRPDGIVAWAGETGFDPAEMTRSAARWFGAPEPIVPA